MSIKVSALCWKVSLPATTKIVLMRLADFANDTGGSIYPSVETVSKECGLSTRSVQGAFRSLETDRLLIMVASCKGGRGKTNTYRIDLGRVAEMIGSAGVEEAECDVSRSDVHEINPASGAGFSNGNPAGDALNPANPALNPARGAQNPAPDAPNPPLTVNEPDRRDSEAKASGVSTPSTVVEISPVKALFDHGVRILTGHGQTEKQARGTIASLRKAKGDAEAAKILVMAEGKTNAVSYIYGAINNRERFVPNGCRIDADGVLCTGAAL